MHGTVPHKCMGDLNVIGMKAMGGEIATRALAETLYSIWHKINIDS